MERPILLFDGVCNLCSGTVQFILKHDKTGELLFASLQSDIGRELLMAHKLSTSDFNSLVLIEDGQYFLRSVAALRIAKHLKAPYRWLRIFGILPVFIRNWAYDLIAKNRYRWFGKKESCWLPTPALQERFLA